MAESVTLGKFLRDYGTIVLAVLTVQGALWLACMWGGYKLVEVISVQKDQQTQINGFAQELPLIRYQLNSMDDSLGAIKKKIGAV